MENKSDSHEFQQEYPYGKADWVPFHESGVMISDPELIAQKMTDFITQRGNSGFRLVAVSDLPDKPYLGKFLFFVPKE